LEDLDTEVEIDSAWEMIRENIKIAAKESTAEPLVPGPSRLEVEIAIAKFEKYKSPGCGEIPEELLQAGGKILLSAIHKLINSVWNKEELPDQWKESIIVSVHKKGDKTDCNKFRGTSVVSTI
jgi:hypothetical protein